MESNKQKPSDGATSSVRTEPEEEEEMKNFDEIGDSWTTAKKSRSLVMRCSVKISAKSVKRFSCTVLPTTTRTT